MQIGAEITVIRRDLEVAFDQFEKFQQTAEYSPDLSHIAKQLPAVAHGDICQWRYRSDQAPLGFRSRHADNFLAVARSESAIG